MFSNLANILVFLLMISVLVAAHEYGHYLFAKLFKMDVEEFAIGFGRKPLWIWRRKPQQDSTDTIFTIRPWPIGGFVKIAGMVPEDDGSEIHVRNGFYSKPPLQRFIVLLAGPFFSVAAGLLALVTLYSITGIPKDLAKIDLVVKDGIAHKAGLQAGDRFLAVEGKTVSTFPEVRQAIASRPNKLTAVKIERNGEIKEFTLTPSATAEAEPVTDVDGQPTGENAIQGRIGVAPSRGEYVKAGFGEVLGYAVGLPITMTKGLAKSFTNWTRFKSGVGGPGTIYAATAAATREGFGTIIELTGLLSISLGVFNLLPVPPLDGGQMVIAFWEMLRKGRRLSMKVQQTLATAGLSLVLLLIFCVIVVDVQRWILPQKEVKPPVAAQPKK